MAKRKPISRPADVTLADLATVSVDHAASTRQHEVFRARSDSQLSATYKVVYAVAESRWTCECQARAHVTCRHRIKAAVLREARFFERLLLDSSPAELRALIPGKQQQVATDTDALSACGALLAISALLMAAGEEWEVAA